jgi:hypothetical protein
MPHRDPEHRRRTAANGSSATRIRRVKRCGAGEPAIRLTIVRTHVRTTGVIAKGSRDISPSTSGPIRNYAGSSRRAVARGSLRLPVPSPSLSGSLSLSCGTVVVRTAESECRWRSITASRWRGEVPTPSKTSCLHADRAIDESTRCRNRSFAPGLPTRKRRDRLLMAQDPKFGSGHRQRTLVLWARGAGFPPERP